MTREEAIDYLQDAKSALPHKFDKALDMAIEALSAPSGDVISRADAIDAIPDTTADMFENCRNCKLLDREQVIDILSALPSADVVSREAHYDAVVNRITDMEERGFVPVVRCKDCRHQEHCHETVAHTKDHDGFREHWSEPIEWCSRGERREP